MKPTALLIAALGAASLAGSASAATCTANAGNAVSLGGAFQPCAPGGGNDDKASNADAAKWTVNEETIFGGGWTAFQRTSKTGTDFGDVDFSDGSNGTGGMFRVTTGFWDRYGEAMVVFDGSNSSKVSPETYLAYALKPNTYAFYVYVTPFLESGARGALSPSGINNMTLYARPVPLPPAAVLFLSALGGLGLLSRRRAA
jgi:hypothetical protein